MEGIYNLLQYLEELRMEELILLRGGRIPPLRIIFGHDIYLICHFLF